mmetsp:Transcript_38169/g.93616  ORF Transcript_38169/g.93616 Transcript_38169/m.93616 type:complete len:233 (-) Transcript_38169:7-705(-)
MYMRAGAWLGHSGPPPTAQNTSLIVPTNRLRPAVAIDHTYEPERRGRSSTLQRPCLSAALRAPPRSTHSSTGALRSRRCSWRGAVVSWPVNVRTRLANGPSAMSSTRPGMSERRACACFCATSAATSGMRTLRRVLPRRAGRLLMASRSALAVPLPASSATSDTASCTQPSEPAPPHEPTRSSSAAGLPPAAAAASGITASGTSSSARAATAPATRSRAATNIVVVVVVTRA